MQIYTKESLTEALVDISNMGWVSNRRRGNMGGIGNTLEDLLGIEENNLPLPNAAEWELKTQRIGTSSLTTLFHMEPSPRAMRFVSNVLVPLYGWKHQDAGTRYPEDENSFRQTLNFCGTDRGFYISNDNVNRRIVVSFDANRVDNRHSEWLKSVKKRVGLGQLDPQPYWGYDDLASKARTKLLNCFYVKAEVKKENSQEYCHYSEIYRCSDFSFNKFLERLKEGIVYVDFDARTGHNHGTKFRLRQTADTMQTLYDNVVRIK